MSLYLPRHFEEADPTAIARHIDAYPLGTLVTYGDGELSANHIPFELVRSDAGDRLRGHVARANPVWRTADPNVLVVFHGPDSYVSPSWMPSKQENHRVVPTWNYQVVHVYGRFKAIEDPAWLRQQIDALTARREAGREAPWKVADAPADYIEGALRAIVGIEIEVTRIVAKDKNSQNRLPADRAGIAEGLRREGGRASALGEALARFDK